MSTTADRFRPARDDLSSYQAQHFLWQVDGKVATITLNRPERKNPLTLEFLRRTARPVPRSRLRQGGQDRRWVTGAGGNFCSGGDVHEIIGPLVEMQRADDMAGLLAFTRMTGDLVKAMRACPQPIVAAGRRDLRRGRRDRRDGVRPALRYRGIEGGVPVRPCRSRGGRHGGLQHPAAHRRRRAGRRAPLYGTVDGRRRGRALGILQQAVRAGFPRVGRAGDGEDARRRSDLRAPP